MSSSLKVTATQMSGVHQTYNERSIRGSHFRTDDWHERVERACRGKMNFEAREQLHRSVTTVFAYFETMQNPAYMDSLTLLQAYEALLALLPHAGRYEDSLFSDHIRACRMEMIYRLKGQIPAEMGKSYLNRTQDDYDIFQFV